jgi:tetratricopeptide (TPR) repeat protein
VALAAAGRYGGAVQVLTPLLEPGESEDALPEQRLFASFAASTMASVQRQLGRHPSGRELDMRALALADTPEASFDAHLGLAADAVGLQDAAAAAEALEEAAELVAGRSDWWRQQVRLDWERAELSLLEGDPDTAVTVAASAVDRAEAARAPRHVAKGLLFQGVAEVQAGHPEAAATLRRAATLAESLGTLPLIWPSRALLGALLDGDDEAESARSLAAARSAVLAIAGDLPPAVREEWLNRPDVAALLGG